MSALGEEPIEEEIEDNSNNGSENLSADDAALLAELEAKDNQNDIAVSGNVEALKAILDKITSKDMKEILDGMEITMTLSFKDSNK